MVREDSRRWELRLELGGRGLPVLVALAWAATALLWLLDAVAAPGGDAAPAGLDRLVAGIALAATAALLLRQAGRLWGEGAAGRLLLGLVALSGLVYFAGLDHELTQGYFRDEGIYRATARRINEQGRIFSTWFVYPHLLFYLDALATWMAELFRPAVALLGRLLHGVETADEAMLLVIRWVTGLMGALTVVPVFCAARRLGGARLGTWAAGLAGGLAVFSPVYLDVAHLGITDVSGGFFAALAFHRSAVLLDGESRRGYLLAGLFAGLAAGSKYPAGIVAVAIAAVWLRWRIAERRWSWGLAWAALAAMATFVATTPSLVAYPGAAYTGGPGVDLLNGIRQYAQGGWTGVVRESNLRYYGGLFARDLGLPAVLLGLVGVFGLGRARRSRLLWMVPFPALYLALILGMQIAVRRTLMPVLPAVDVLVGVAAAGCLAWLPRERRRLRLAGGALLAAACLALPAWRAILQDVRFVRPTTRELAEAWVAENLPPGTFTLREIYTPELRPRHLYPSRYVRYVVRLPPDELRDPYHDYVMVASGAYTRFTGRQGDPRGRRYREIFDTFPLVKELEPGPLRNGPALRLYEVDPADPPYTDRLERPAAAAAVSDPAMRSDDRTLVRFAVPGQWALFKGYLERGTWRVRVDADLAADGGAVRAVTRRGREVAAAPLSEEGVARLRLPARDKYLLYVTLPWGSTLRGLTARRSSPSPATPPAPRPRAPVSTPP